MDVTMSTIRWWRNDNEIFALALLQRRSDRGTTLNS